MNVLAVIIELVGELVEGQQLTLFLIPDPGAGEL